MWPVCPCVNSRTRDSTTASHGRTTVSPAGKSSSLFGTLLAAVAGHLLLAALVAPVVTAVTAGAAVLTVATVGFVAAGLRDRVDLGTLRRRASREADDPRRSPRDGAPCRGADC